MPNLFDLQNMTGRAIKQSVRGRCKSFFYTSAQVSVAAITGAVLGETQTRINIDGDSHFVCTGLSGEYLLSTGLRTIPQLHAEPEVQLQEEGTGFILFDRPIRWGLIVGTGRRHFRFDPPYCFKSRSTVLVTFRNPETVAYNVNVTLSGYKLFL
jgi:hypothetical protein